MRAALLLSLFLSSLGFGLAQAQTTPAKPPAGQTEKPASAPGKTEQKIENIRHEDAGSRIDELRVGGETKSITVQPKGQGKAPAYEVDPGSSNRNPAATDRERGSGGWKIRSF